MRRNISPESSPLVEDTKSIFPGEDAVLPEVATQLFGYTALGRILSRTSRIITPKRSTQVCWHLQSAARRQKAKKAAAKS